MNTAVKTRMEIPLVHLHRQYQNIKPGIDKAVKKVIDAQAFIMGEEINALERSIAGYCNVKYAVGVSSGTDALFLSLKALGIKEGDEVITTPFTFIATAEAISNTGATPVFADIDKRTYNIDPEKIEEKMTKRTKAIIPVHLYGQCADMDSISAVSRKYGLKIVEDCAQSLGALYKNRRSCSLGDIGCISFFPSKNLGGFGDGGMVATDNAELAEKIKLLRVHGSSVRYVHSVVGYNSRLDNLQAAVLNVKLEQLDGWIEKRIRNAKALNEAFKDIGDIITPYVPNYNIHTYHQYTLRVDEKIRDSFVDHLNKSGIESRVYYPIPLHVQECYKFLGYNPGSLPESSKAARSTLVLPVFPEMSDDEKEYIIKTVREFYQTKEL